MVVVMPIVLENSSSEERVHVGVQEPDGSPLPAFRAYICQRTIPQWHRMRESAGLGPTYLFVEWWDHMMVSIYPAFAHIVKSPSCIGQSNRR